MAAHGRNADAGLVHVGGAVDSGACRHHEGKRHDDVRRRITDVVDTARLEAEESDIAGVAIKAFDQRRGRGITDQLQGDAKPCRQRARDRLDHRSGAVAMDFTGGRVLDELRQMHSDADLAGTHDVCNARIGHLLAVGGCQWGQQYGRHEYDAETRLHAMPSILLSAT